MKPRYGIIGCGGIARFHLEGLEKFGAEVAHVVDVDPAKADAAARRFHARAGTDYRALVNDPEVTVVSVLTPTRLHAEMCLAAIEAGKDVICEKTLANSAEEAYRIVEAVKRTGVIFFTAYMKRFFPVVQEAKALIPSLGTLFSAHARTYQPWGIDFFTLRDAAPHSWILDNYGGGILKCGGSHILDLVLFLLGRPQSLGANMRWVGDSRLDGMAKALLDHPGGLCTSFEAAAHPLELIGFERNGLDERIEITGTGGRLDLYSVAWNKPETNAALLVHHDNSSRQSIEYRCKAINPFHAQMEYMHGCLSERKQGRPDAVDGYAVDELIETIERSARSGASVQPVWKDA